jgi:fatty acid-binding protein DegV
VDDTLAKLRELLPLTKSFALIEELSFAVKGGRVPRYVKLIADFLRVTPILVTTPEGRIAPGGVVRGRKDPLPGFARFIAKRVDRSVPLRVTIGHAVCPDKARRLDAMLHEQLPHIGKSNICELGSALGAHGGPGTLVVGLQHERPPSRGRGISLANNA